MNTPSRPDTESRSSFEDYAAEHPSSALLLAVGCGLALGLLVRTIFPHPPESRAARLLAEVRDRLHDIAEPIQRHTENLMESGAGVVKSGVSQLQDLHLERGIQKLGKRFRKLFS